MTPLPQELLDLKASISIAIHNDDCTGDEKEVAAKALDTLLAENAELQADRDRLLAAAKANVNSVVGGGQKKLREAIGER